jgi:hypothetical protein
MTLTLLPDKYCPDWREEESVQHLEYYWSHSYRDTGRTLLFFRGTSDEGAAKAIRAAREQLESAKSRYVILYGWNVCWKGLHVPFSVIISGSAILVLAGVVLLIFAAKGSK